MTEIINVQTLIFGLNCSISNDIDLEHKGISFHLEVNNRNVPRLSLLSSKYLQVFIFNTVNYDLADTFIKLLMYLKYNNISSKILIVELTHEMRPYYLEDLIQITGLEGYYMNFDDKEEFYNQEEFKDKLLEMSLENEEVLESSVVNDIFSQFLNTGKVEKTVVEDFCFRNSLDLSYCLKILKENNNLFEYSKAYYFVHDKCLTFFQKISKLKFNNGMTTYEELEKIFENDTDLAINFLESKNILIKSQDRYAYSFASPKYNITKNPKEFISSNPKNISLEFELQNPIKFLYFFKKISKNRIIVSISENSIFIDNNIFIFFNRDVLKIYFFEKYDLDIIISLLNFIEFRNVEIVIKDEYKIGQTQIKYYFEEDFYEGYIKYYNEEIEDVKSIIKVIYPIITNN